MSLQSLAVNTIRLLAADTVQKANSGHPGMPMGMAPVAHVLWTRHLRFNSKNPQWMNRDRFLLSNGHGCSLQYALLHLAGYDVSISDLQSFRQLGSKTPGHPEVHVTPGIEVTTGPLGQGVANGVGLAIAAKHAADKFNRPGFPVIDAKTFVFLGDGCMMEGIASEACSLAGHLGLDNLVLIYDDNKITIDGSTDIAFTEDVAKRFEAYGFHVITVADGDNDLDALDRALTEARASVGKPVLIRVRTTIGYGAKLQGTPKTHGAPLGAEDLANVKRKFGFDAEKSFFVPDEVKALWAEVGEKGARAEAQWNAMLEQYAKEFPELAAEYHRLASGKLPEDWQSVLPTFKPADAAVATRKLGEGALAKLADRIPEIIGGSADLVESNLTHIKGSPDFQKDTPCGRNIRFGIREFAMGAICNGIYAFGLFIPYCATFMNFIQYLLPALRLSALSHMGVVYIGTHDSIGVGEDGPTHQPIEMLAALRSTPNVCTLRPADGNEVSGAYAIAVENRRRPTVLALTRQNLPHLEGSSAEKVKLGAYVLRESASAPQLILVGTGSEVHLLTQAADQLKDIQVRVVSMPSWELFEEQPLSYRESVLLPGAAILSAEAASTQGWSRYAHAHIGMTSFGASAPLKDVMKLFGFTVDNVVAKSKALVEFFATKPAPPVAAAYAPF